MQTWHLALDLVTLLARVAPETPALPVAQEKAIAAFLEVIDFTLQTLESKFTVTAFTGHNTALAV